MLGHLFLQLQHELDKEIMGFTKGKSDPSWLILTNFPVPSLALKLHVLVDLISMGTLNREWIVVPFGSSCAATPLEAVARATNPSPRTAFSKVFTRKVG